MVRQSKARDTRREQQGYHSDAHIRFLHYEFGLKSRFLAYVTGRNKDDIDEILREEPEEDVEEDYIDVG